MRVMKYPLQQGLNEIEMPQQATVLSAIAKGGGGALYVQVTDEDSEMETRAFLALQTGETSPIDPTNSTFIGSLREPGSHTWHVFEVAATAPDALPEHLTATAEAE